MAIETLAELAIRGFDEPIGPIPKSRTEEIAAATEQLVRAFDDARLPGVAAPTTASAVGGAGAADHGANTAGAGTD